MDKESQRIKGVIDDWLLIPLTAGVITGAYLLYRISVQLDWMREELAPVSWMFKQSLREFTAAEEPIEDLSREDREAENLSLRKDFLPPTELERISKENLGAISLSSILTEPLNTPQKKSSEQ